MDKMKIFKAAITAIITGFAEVLGWKGVLTVIWFLSMIIDYITGSVSAAYNGEWSSKVARKGIFHKAGMLTVVIVSILADVSISIAFENLKISFPWSGYIFPLVITWYIITELGSILENAIKMGANVPEWLVKMLKVSLKSVEEKVSD